MVKEESNLERLQSELDARDSHFGETPRKTLHDIPADVEKNWSEPVKPPPMSPRKTQKKNPLIALFVASVLFFIIASVASGFFFLRGGQPVSGNNIQVEMLGPTTIGGGEELVLQVAFTNKNPVALRAADFIVDFPEGTRSADDVSKNQRQTREQLGVVKSGETVNKTIRAVLFGEEGSQQSVKVTLEYGIESSNAIFFKEQEYGITLSAAPVSLAVTAPKEVVSGQDVSFTVVASSNSPTLLKNLLLKAEYPFGFQFSEGSQKPIASNNVWDLGDLPAGGKRTITIKGTLVGQNTDERFFRFFLGAESEENEKEMGVTYVMKPASLKIAQPFLSAQLSLDGSSAEKAVVKAGKNVRADITWKNNLPSTVLDGEIKIKITGAALDRNSITTERGFFNSNDNTIVWTGSTDSALQSVESGESGRVGFTFSTLGLASGQTFKNPELIFEVSVGGRRVSEIGSPETITSGSKHTLQIATDLLLSSKVTRSTGPFANVGPVPPKVGQETTYTVTWSALSSSNAVEDVVVKTTLPTYVRFMGTVSPAGEKVEYSPVGGTVTWKVGTVEPGSQTSAKKEVSFQVALLPSSSQVKTTPILINEQSISGTDRFTGATVGTTRPLQTTRLSADPAAQFTDGVVVE